MLAMVIYTGSKSLVRCRNVTLLRTDPIVNCAAIPEHSRIHYLQELDDYIDCQSV